VLQAAGILKGRQVTCHPGVAAKLTATPRRHERVVVDGKIVEEWAAHDWLSLLLQFGAEVTLPAQRATG
jgi:putative intracellular protease/amidase